MTEVSLKIAYLKVYSNDADALAAQGAKSSATMALIMLDE